MIVGLILIHHKIQQSPDERFLEDAAKTGEPDSSMRGSFHRPRAQWKPVHRKYRFATLLSHSEKKQSKEAASSSPTFTELEFLKKKSK